MYILILNLDIENNYPEKENRIYWCYSWGFYLI